MTKSIPYWLVAQMFRGVVLLFQILIALFVANVTGQTFRRNRNPRPFPSPRFE